jgi:aminomethyltransferase
MKSTPLTQIHQDLGAKMAEFAGYNMPIQYTGITDEHHAVRNNVGVFDVSHMGEFIIKGKEALQLVQKISSNDASKLEINQAQYSCMPNLSGGIVDDLLIYRLPEDNCAAGEQAFMLVVNASNMEKDWNWIKENNNFDTRMIDISDETGLLAVQGPNAIKALQGLCDIDLNEISYYTFRKGTFAGIENVIISATGYTGSGGFELYCPSDKLKALWEAIFDHAKDLDIKPIGLGARDTLRLEMAFCLYGNDIDDQTSPLEAGLGWITKLKAENNDFNNKAYFINQKEAGLERKLVGFTLDGRRVPRHGYKIFNTDEEEIGYVTSGTQSPSLGHPIGLGYVPKELAKIGNKLLIQAGKKFMEATIVKPPFYKG